MIAFLFIVLFLLSAFLILIVLLQRGRGAGLAGAFGSGGGSQSAFGTKTGDVFTTVTVIAFVLFMLLSIGLFTKIKWGSQPDSAPSVVNSTAPVNADLVTDTSVEITWTDKSSNVLGYHVMRFESHGALTTEGGVLQDKDVPSGGKLVSGLRIPDEKEMTVIDVPVDRTRQENTGNSVVLVHYLQDKGLKPGTTYAYIIRGWNKANGKVSEGDALEIAVKTTGVAPPPVTQTAPATTQGIEPPASATMGATLPASAPATQTKPASAPGPAAAPVMPGIGPMPAGPAAPSRGPATATAPKP